MPATRAVWRPILAVLFSLLFTNASLAWHSSHPERDRSRHQQNRTARGLARPARSGWPVAAQRLRRLALASPLRFEANRGQTDARARFLARGPGYSLFLTGDEAVLALRGARGGASRSQSAVVTMRLAGAQTGGLVRGEGPLPGTSSYFHGSDPRHWQRGVPAYASVRYPAVYPGIDLLYHGKGGKLEHDFVLAPGADPRRIRVAYSGLTGTAPLRIDARGDLRLRTPLGELRQPRPVCYQVAASGRRVSVEGQYVLLPEKYGSVGVWEYGSGTPHNHQPSTINHRTHTPTLPHSHTPTQVSFRLAAYDRTRPLVIDPVLEYSTFLGGSGEEILYGAAVGADGSLFLVGDTPSVDFPTTPGAFVSGSSGIFLTHIAPDGSSLIYSALIDGASAQMNPDSPFVKRQNPLAVDAAGNAFVVGHSSSRSFPLFRAFQGAIAGRQDMVVFGLDPTGSSLLFSTYLGGDETVGLNGTEAPVGIVVDGAGAVVVAGSIGPVDFPVTANAFQKTRSPFDIGPDCFITKFDRAGDLLYSTFLGGTWPDDLDYMLLAPSGAVCVVGYAESPDFPLRNPSSTSSKGGFVCRVSSGGSNLSISEFLNSGGGFLAAAVDAQDNVVVTGSVASNNFQTTPGAFSRTYSGGPGDAFVTRFSSAGKIVFSTYLGGTGEDEPRRVATDPAGNVYVTGWTLSPDFPTGNAVQIHVPGASGDPFVTKFDPKGSLIYSTYLAGSGDDISLEITADATGRAYVAGETSSVDFPLVSPVQKTLVGGSSLFVASIAPQGGSLLFSTYLGGDTGVDAYSGYHLRRLLTTPDGELYLVGDTLTDLPLVNPLQPNVAGHADLFVLKLGELPDAPSDLVATPITFAEIDLAWKDHSANELRFEVERQTGSAAFAKIAETGPNVTHYADTGLTSNTRYSYRVRAVSRLGPSTYSNVAIASTAPNPPSAPNALTAVALSRTSVRLGWRDTSDNEQRFEVERRPGGLGDSGAFVKIAGLPAGSVAYTDSGLTVETTYTYRVRAFGIDGPSGYSNLAEVTTLPNAPAAPTGLSALAASGTEVDLAWNDNSTNETGFSIERANGIGAFAVFAQVGPDTQLYSDLTVSPEKSYTYRVQALNGGGASAYASSSTVQTLAAPTGLAAKLLSSTQLTLTWKDASQYEAGFSLERSSGGAFAEVARPGANATTYTDTSVFPETAYTYRVRARHATGYSGFSNSIAVTPLAAPANLQALATAAGQVTLTWADRSANEAGFLVERSVPGQPFVPLGSAARDATAYFDRTVAPDSAYTYRVRATSPAGSSSYSNEASLRTDPTPPAAPRGLTVAANSQTELALSWVDASSNEDGFRIERKKGTGWEELAVVTAGKIRYLDGNLQADTDYTYRVRAYNNGGASAYSNEATGRTLPLPPSPAPSGLTVTVLSAHSLGLSWVDEIRNEDGFQLERAGPDGVFHPLATTAANVVAYTDSGLAPETRYRYRLRAFNRAGVSGYSTVAEATTLPELPAAPSGLTAKTVSSGEIDLGWKDGSTNEQVFLIERKGGSGGSAYQQIASVGANVTAFQNTGLDPGVTYTYRVRATNAAGNSAYSNEASATTAAPLDPVHSLTVRPARVKGGRSAQGTVTLAAAAPAGGVKVALSSSRAEVMVPASIEVPAGKTQARFTIHTRRVKRRVRATLAAAAGGATKSAVLAVTK